MLSIFQHIYEDPTVALVRASAPAAAPLAEYAELWGISGNVWQHYLASLLATDDNILAKTADRWGKAGESLTTFAMQDLEELRALFLTATDPLLAQYTATNPPMATPFAASILRLCHGLTRSAASAYEALMRHYTELGRGEACRYIAFYWENGLQGIKNTDAIAFDDLVGYTAQKQAVIDNTALFLQGKGGNNMLLFGDSGTGKSSSVKAVLNQFCAQGLRLVEFHKHQMHLLPALLDELSTRGQKYIVFMDDLSFEENEIEYKYLKAVLSGSASAALPNVRYYATSNRRHLIREVWADRVCESEEVFISDTVREKLALADRFGMTVYFSSLDQEEYLNVVAQLCAAIGVAYTDTVRQKALTWSVGKTRSGRTAKQFVDGLG